MSWEDRDSEDNLEYQQRLAASVRLDRATRAAARSRADILLLKRRLAESEQGTGVFGGGNQLVPRG